jgi:PmbA protein
VAGEFSMGALGYRIRKGRRAGPVTGVTIAGALKETLFKIDAVADRIKFSGDSGSPALLIGEMDVSGPGTGRNG